MVWQPYYSPLGPYQATYPYGQNNFSFQDPNAGFLASGNIRPSRFVTLCGNNLVQQSVAGDWPLAVAVDYTQAANTSYAATDGYPIQTYGSGYDCWLELGGTVREGRLLVPDDEGRGIEGLISQHYAAKAYQAGEAGDLIRVRVSRLGPLNPDCYSDWSYEFSYEFGNDCSGPQP